MIDTKAVLYLDSSPPGMSVLFMQGVFRKCHGLSLPDQANDAITMGGNYGRLSDSYAVDMAAEEKMEYREEYDFCKAFLSVPRELRRETMNDACLQPKSEDDKQKLADIIDMINRYVRSNTHACA